MLRFTLFALLAVLTVASADNSISLGHREHGDSIVQQKQVDKEYRTWRVTEHTETITVNGNLRITQLDIIDVKKKETSAVPQVLSGGPGQSYVTLKFKSKRGHGIHFLVRIYAKPAY